MDWHKRWVENTTTWDLGAPHPMTKSILEKSNFLVAGSVKVSWIIPGCGRAHDAVALNECGATKIHAVDLSEIAIAEARKLYDRKFDICFDAVDINSLVTSHQGMYSGVFDRAMMCALTGVDRKEYLNTVKSLLKPGGLFVSIPFAKVSRPENGPPFQISEGEIRELFSMGWNILHLQQMVSPACDQKILSEWALIVQKVSDPF
jgi:thiopurine S-methyltransferase